MHSSYEGGGPLSGDLEKEPALDEWRSTEFKLGQNGKNVARVVEILILEVGVALYC